MATEILTRAQGFLELKMYEEAWEELMKVPKGDAPPGWFDLCLGVAAGMKEFEQVERFAREFAAGGHRSLSVYMYGAGAIRQLKSPADALEFLQGGRDLHFTNAFWHYYKARLEAPAATSLSRPTACVQPSSSIRSIRPGRWKRTTSKRFGTAWLPSGHRSSVIIIRSGG